MEKYGSGTRVLLAGRSRSDIIYQTTVGSPVRFDAAYVSGCVQFPSGVGYCQVPIVGPKTSIVSTPLFSSINYQAASSPGATVTLMAWLNASGQEVARIRGGSYATMQFEVYNGATFTAIGPTFSIPASTLFKLDTKVIPGVGGELTAWVGGSLVSSTTGGLNAAFDEVSFVRFQSSSVVFVSYMSEYALADEDLRSYRFGSDAITGAGFYNDGTGVATDTADADLNTFKGLPANGNKYTGTTPARSLPGNTVIDSVMLSSVMRTAAPIGNAKALLRISSADYTSANVAPVPNAGYELRMPYFDANPDTGLPWAIADYNSAEKGNEAAT